MRLCIGKGILRSQVVSLPLQSVIRRLDQDVAKGEEKKMECVDINGAQKK